MVPFSQADFDRLQSIFDLFDSADNDGVAASKLSNDDIVFITRMSKKLLEKLYVYHAFVDMNVAISDFSSRYLLGNMRELHDLVCESEGCNHSEQSAKTRAFLAQKLSEAFVAEYTAGREKDADAEADPVIAAPAPKGVH